MRERGESESEPAAQGPVAGLASCDAITVRSACVDSPVTEGRREILGGWRLGRRRYDSPPEVGELRMSGIFVAVPGSQTCVEPSTRCAT